MNDRIQWSGSDWHLRVYELTLPDGSRRQKGYLDHPGAVTIVPLESDGQHVLMLHQYRRALDETILELPAGTRRNGESWQECARRELREETGQRAEQWLDLGQIWPAPGVSNEVMALYLARGLSPDPLPPDVDEQIEVRAYRLSELATMAMDGRLRDAKSVVALLRAASYLRNGD
ncbi:MAG: NUDIX hydrolase [Candidatus Promineifilaceae bacterium]|nr:NUDIX hydrolase [Candidatus Promineifilaceae bacterium]